MFFNTSDPDDLIPADTPTNTPHSQVILLTRPIQISALRSIH